jgi:hypothetical protein
VEAPSEADAPEVPIKTICLKKLEIRTRTRSGKSSTPHTVLTGTKGVTLLPVESPSLTQSPPPQHGRPRYNHHMLVQLLRILELRCSFSIVVDIKDRAVEGLFSPGFVGDI